MDQDEWLVVYLISFFFLLRGKIGAMLMLVRKGAKMGVSRGKKIGNRACNEGTPCWIDKTGRLPRLYR